MATIVAVILSVPPASKAARIKLSPESSNLSPSNIISRPLSFTIPFKPSEQSKKTSPALTLIAFWLIVPSTADDVPSAFNI